MNEKIRRLLEMFIALLKQPESVEAKLNFDAALSDYKIDAADDHTVRATVAYRVDAIIDDVRRAEMGPRERLATDLEHAWMPEAERALKRDDAGKSPREAFCDWSRTAWKRKGVG
jgi:hypothetical protein